MADPRILSISNQRRILIQDSAGSVKVGSEGILQYVVPDHNDNIPQLPTYEGYQQPLTQFIMPAEERKWTHEEVETLLDWLQENRDTGLQPGTHALTKQSLPDDLLLDQFLHSLHTSLAALTNMVQHPRNSP